MRLHITAVHKDEIAALVGWMRLSLYSQQPPALRSLDVDYTEFFESGEPRQAIIEMEFNDTLTMAHQ